MKFKLGALYGVAVLVFSGTVAGEWTPWNVKVVADIYVQPSGYIVTAVDGWGTTCPDYLRIERTESNARELLSLVLTAKANSRKVSAEGFCAGGWFQSNHIIMH